MLIHPPFFPQGVRHLLHIRDRHRVWVHDELPDARIQVAVGNGALQGGANDRAHGRACVQAARGRPGECRRSDGDTVVEELHGEGALYDTQRNDLP
jgi:hypothetical protein